MKKLQSYLLATYSIGRLKAICLQIQLEFRRSLVNVPGTSPLGVLKISCEEEAMIKVESVGRDPKGKRTGYGKTLHTR